MTWYVKIFKLYPIALGSQPRVLKFLRSLYTCLMYVSGGVCVYGDILARAAKTDYHRLRGVKADVYVLHSLAAGKSTIEVPVGEVRPEGSSLAFGFQAAATSLCAHADVRFVPELGNSWLCGVSSDKDPNPITRPPPKGPPPNAIITLGGRAPTCEFGGDTHIQSLTRGEKAVVIINRGDGEALRRSHKIPGKRKRRAVAK